MKNFNSFPILVEANRTRTSTEIAMSLSSPSHFSSEKPTGVDINQLTAIMTVTKVARSLTVRIHNSLGGSSSGVIVSRQENHYTVLTTAHVVDDTDTGVQYTVHTHKNKKFPVTRVLGLQPREGKLNLAIVQFYSADAYPVATLGNSDDSPFGTDIYVSGYLRTLDTESQEFKFTNGSIVDRPNEKLLYYHSPTWSGMNGAPIFDVSTRVVGIHMTTVLDLESRTGFNIAISADTIINLLAQANMTDSP
jgi:serine protease Do